MDLVVEELKAGGRLGVLRRPRIISERERSQSAANG
jgi:hypothetical protein